MNIQKKNDDCVQEKLSNRLVVRRSFAVGTAFPSIEAAVQQHPRIIPTDRIKNMNNDLDIDSVQNKNLSSITVPFWIMNKPVVATRIMPM